MNWYIIFFFLLAVVLYLYTRYIRLQRNSHKEKIEAFQTTARMTPIEKLQSAHGITLTFLTANTAASQMQTQAREYIALMNQPNLAARGVQTQEELLAAYSQAFQDIPLVEQERVIEFVLELLSKVQYKYPAYYRYLIKWISQISLAKSQMSLEGGMPHTLGKIVILDAGWFANPRATTFLHEITHVHQRLVPFEFEDLYSEWGYVSTPMRDIHGMEPVLQLNRNNPDGTSPDWLWLEPSTNKTAIMPSSRRNMWWIGAVFQTATPASLGDINLIALKIEQDHDGHLYYLKQQPTPLNSLKPFILYFGGANPNNYHPNEMTAKFAEWYVEDMLGNPQPQHRNHENNENYENHKNNIVNGGYQVYHKYFSKLLESYY
jgi:hypothetical protein